MAEIKRIDPEGLRLRLSAAYGSAPGPVGAGVIVAIMQEFHDTMVGLYESYTTTLFGVKKRQLIRALSGWNRSMRAIGKRIEAYWMDSCQDLSECPDEEFPKYTDEWVADPILRGVWPDEFYLGVPLPSPERPDAIVLAQLWNQLVAVQGIAHQVGPIRDMLYAIAERAEINLAKSAPGEDPTAADIVAAAWDKFKKDLGGVADDAGEALRYIGFGVAVIGIAWLALRKRRK